VWRVWTHGRIFIDLPTFHFLLVGVVVNAIWNASSIVPIAANQHSRIALEQLAAVALSLGLVIVLMHPMGLPGAGLGLLLGECLMIVIVLPLSIRLLNDNLRDFSKSLLDPRAIWSQVARLRSGTGR
jgi:O-antigen/teichoic acid export membrane protein